MDSSVAFILAQNKKTEKQVEACLTVWYKRISDVAEPRKTKLIVAAPRIPEKK